ncbi:hypothetical protein [Leifsonia sp. NPDC080035]|uniref:4'-phosphopantetheinyl transferase superfamily protein n=1 Tax=Leifsonia sp. NPDC080035 TaxID=3143936 RepID=A0AAU7GAR6_9MICO
MLPLVVRSHEAATSAVLTRLSEADRTRLAGLSGNAAAAFLAGRDALLAAADAAAPDGRGIGDARIDATCPDCGGSHGRPYLLGRPDIHLSLTHAAGFAFAVVAAGPVGIDAEPLDTDPARVAAAAFLTPGHGDALRRWTAIEAVLKADGRGLRVDPAAVRIEAGSAVLDGTRYRVRSRRLHGCLVTTAQALSAGSRV